jgi:FLYWCH zinc finger domain
MIRDKFENSFDVKDKELTAKKKDRGQQSSSTSFTVPFQFLESGRRNQVMICEGRKYIQNNKYGEKIYWKCSKWHDGCKARAITLLSQPDCIIRRNEHNHPSSLNETGDDVKDISLE